MSGVGTNILEYRIKRLIQETEEEIVILVREDRDCRYEVGRLMGLCEALEISK